MTNAPNAQAGNRALPWLVAIGFFMQLLDATILNTALPSMARDLGVSPLRMQSVILAYLLTVAVLIPASGWLADRFGTRRIFQGAIVLFSLGSLLCALSSGLGQLVMARVLQGVGAALLMPVGRLALLRSFSRDQLIRVLSFVALPGLVGPLMGPTLGGWIVEMASWRWIFIINLPVGLAGLVATACFMPNATGPRRRFDTPGFLLIGAGLLLITLSLQGLSGRGPGTRATSALMLLAGLGCLTAYWRYATRARAALFDPALLRLPIFGLALLGNLVGRLGSGAMPFMMPLLLQLSLGYSPSLAGMTMIPATLGAMATKTFAERLIRRVGYRYVLIANTVVLGAVIASFALVNPGVPHAWVLVHLSCFGLLNSMQFTALNTLALSSLDEAHASGGNGLVAVVVQMSMGLGVAIAGGLLTLFGRDAATPGSPEVARTIHSTFAVIGLITVFAAFVFVRLRSNFGRTEQAPPWLPEE